MSTPPRIETVGEPPLGRAAERERPTHEDGADEVARTSTLEELRVLEARYRRLFDRSLAGVYRSSRCGRILDCNDAFARMLGYESRAEVLTLNAEVLYTQAADREEFLSRLAMEGSLAGYQVRLQRKDGSAVWGLENVSLVGDPVQGEVIEGTIVDITERVEFEERTRRQHAELEHVARLITAGQIAAAMAHEVGQPLAAIGNLVEATACGLRREPGAIDRHLEYLRLASEQVAQAGEIVRRTLGFVRKAQPVRAPLLVDELAVLAAKLAAVDARQRGISIQLELRPGLPAVDADRVQIQEVLANLLHNAVEAIDAAGLENRTVTLRTRMDADGRVGISVSDDGPGVPAAERSALFTAFRSQKPDGLGLGLWICRSIVEAHGGEIRLVDSGPPGATFEFWLPRATEALAVAAGPESAIL